MIKLFSTIEPDRLLAVINTRADIGGDRLDLIPAEEYLQLATKSLKKGVLAKAHKHNDIVRQTGRTQEAWVFLQGRVRATFYDLDDTVILETELVAGDCAVLLCGGHGFEVLDDDTLLYEFKTGPFQGIEKDKAFI